MSRGSAARTRSEISETVKRHEHDMQEKADQMEILAKDTEVVRETLAKLDFDGTSEGTEAVQGAIEEAEDVTVNNFEQEDGRLEDVQAEAQDNQTELQDRADSSELDLGRMSDASGRIETQETLSKLADAKNAVLEDRDFLGREIEEAEQAIALDPHYGEAHHNIAFIYRSYIPA